VKWGRFFPLSHEQLSNLSYNLATCLAAGVPLPRAFRTATQSLAQSDSPSWSTVGDRLELGDSLTDALRAVEHRVPRFYLPLVAAGEQTGRLDEVLRHAARQCRLLARPVRALRTVWLAPLAIYLVAIPLEFLLLIMGGNWSSLLTFMSDAIAQLGSIAVTVLLLVAPPLKPAWDRLRLLIPVWGRAERDMSVSRFVRLFGLLFATGGTRVESMIRFAGLSVANDHVRRDLLNAARQIEHGADLARVFSACACLTDEERQLLAAGELSGTVEQACDRLADQLDDAVEARLKIVSAVAFRVTIAAVSLSLLGALSGIVRSVLLR
jgi:general secretion pathway protein F